MRKRTKRILAGVMSLATISSFAACSSDEGGSSGGGGANTTQAEATTTTTAKTEWTGDLVDVDVADDDFDTSVDISGKTIKWMGFYDLNPTNDEPDRKTEIAILEDTYNAKLEWIETTWDTQFDDLANSIIGGTPPDIFVHGIAQFPNDINKGQFQAIDSLVDWNDPMWSSVKETADKLMWNGEHYVAPFGYRFDDYQLLMYDADMVEELGMEDPLELYNEGKWDWDSFLSLAKEFQGGDETKFGIAGWWANAIVYSSGDALVTYDGSKFTNNLLSAKIERAQAVIDDLWVHNLVKRGWVDPSQAFADGDTLFYAMGTWAYNSAVDSTGGHTVNIIPFPKDPTSDKYYVNKAIFAHMWVKGSDNADVVKVWYDINRTINYDEKYLAIKKEKQLANNANWTEENYDMVMAFSDDSKFPLAYDYGYGLNSTMNNEVMGILYEGRVNEQWESWITAREEYSTIVDSAISDYQ